MTPKEGEEKTPEPAISSRPGHLSKLIQESRHSLVSNARASHELTMMDSVPETEESPEERERMQQSLRRRFTVLETRDTSRLVEVRLKNLSYHVPIRMGAPQVKTVMNQSVCYGAYEFFHRMSQCCKYWSDRRAQRREGASSPPRASMRSPWLPRTASDVINPFKSTAILHDVNLVLKPGSTYLVLGPPGCGKTSLLKAISGRLPNAKWSNADDEPPKNKAYLSGRVEYNGVCVTDDPYIVLPNICSFVGHLDDHAAYLTVRETFEFAFQCRTGGDDNDKLGINDSQLPDGVDKQNFTENLTIDGMDLTQCADTFVGDSNIRGVSGGQRRRVTIGEMMQGANPVACADEFSTGLDAAVTYDIAFSIVRFAKAAKTTRVVSLLQPGPETFSLFDEVIVLSEGHVIYAGPIDDVVEYFEGLGYMQPERMDVADYLQSIPTVDGSLLFDASKSPSDAHYTTEDFVEAFKNSAQYEQIMLQLNTPSTTYSWMANKGSNNDEEDGGTRSPDVPKEYKTPSQNSFWRSTKLNLSRNFTLWKRDKGFIIGKMFENIGMAVATGGILFGQARLTFDDGDSIEVSSDKVNRLQAGVYGALFMTCFHILLGTMTSTPDDIDQRPIHYKQYDARFYQVYSYVVGRFLSTIPQRSLEIVSFGIPLYFLVGLDLSAKSFFIYLLILICYTIGLKMMFGILAQVLPRKANVQGVGTFIVLLTTLFGGFIVYPNTIPTYYIWIYWANPMAWALQGLATNEFTSGKYDNLPFDGSNFLWSRGFQTGREWIGYTFAYMVPFTLIFVIILGIVLKYVRIEPEQEQVKKKKTVAIGSIAAKEEDHDDFNLPFTPVDLTFENLVYEVKASTGDGTLRLLNEVSGAFVAGRLCALMGSSGAGKTTLMDVIAMRKTSGEVSGEVRLNGFVQERTSFLRSSGYVEQFDVQQAELTVRETVTFCARLRLDANDPAIGSDAMKLRYVDHVLETMELCDIENIQVGSYEEGGLTFEQRKRLAIACELAGSPSVIFLDEPTSGLDSRGALVVIRAMRRIADSGRTVCATIHQPSAAVFELFDDLLLLKRGGNVVFFGDLGEGSCKLIEYFESRGANPIEHGENPAAWVLRAMASDASGEASDWAEVYNASNQYAAMWEQIGMIKESAEESKKITFDNTYAVPYWERAKLMNQRILTVYKRSPAYNLTRLMISVFYSFIIGSVFIRTRNRSTVWQEREADGIISTMFLSLIIMGVTSISMAVPVMKKIRDVFYKHRASGMLGHNAVSDSLLVGETVYLCLNALLFAVVYYVTVGLFSGVGRFLYFWVFTLLNIANYTYFGQAFICLVKDVPTAGALQGALIGYNVFFSGLVVRPQYFNGPFKLGLWTAPGRFAFEGITISQLGNLDVPVEATPYSPFFFSQGCADPETGEILKDPCVAPMKDYVEFFFGGVYNPGNFWMDVGVLLGYLLLARLLTWFALKKFNYVNT